MPSATCCLCLPPGPAPVLSRRLARAGPPDAAPPRGKGRGPRAAVGPLPARRCSGPPPPTGLEECRCNEPTNQPHCLICHLLVFSPLPTCSHDFHALHQYQIMRSCETRKFFSSIQNLTQHFFMDSLNTFALTNKRIFKIYTPNKQPCIIH